MNLINEDHTSFYPSEPNLPGLFQIVGNSPCVQCGTRIHCSDRSKGHIVKETFGFSIEKPTKHGPIPVQACVPFKTKPPILSRKTARSANSSFINIWYFQCKLP